MNKDKIIKELQAMSMLIEGAPNIDREYICDMITYIILNINENLIDNEDNQEMEE